jgi:hypothetical protein
MSPGCTLDGGQERPLSEEFAAIGDLASDLSQYALTWWNHTPVILVGGDTGPLHDPVTDRVIGSRRNTCLSAQGLS